MGVLAWTRLSLCVFATSCAEHTVAVFAPVKEVPEHTVVSASITAGKVTQYPDDTKLGDVVTHLRPDDLVVVNATSGDELGRIRVTRSAGSQALETAGIITMVVGIGLSVIGGAACAGSVEHSSGWFDFSGLATTACYGLGLLGAVASTAIGVPMIIVGAGGPTRIEEKGKLTGATAGFAVRF